MIFSNKLDLFWTSLCYKTLRNGGKRKVFKNYLLMAKGNWLFSKLADVKREQHHSTKWSTCDT
jgi:hypothetical protein